MNTTTNIRGPSGKATSPIETPVTDSSNSISPETAAVIVAIIVPIVVIAIVSICFFQIQKHWKMRQAQATAADAGSDQVGQPEDIHLYLQNKAELSVGQAGYEMQPEGRIYELMDRHQCQEMPEQEPRQPMLSFGGRHELRCEDHARELEVPQNQQDPHRYSFEEPVFVHFNESILSLHEFA